MPAPADVLLIANLNDLPTFCAVARRDDDPAHPAWIDFWAVEPCGGSESDYLRGQRYGEEAISHVRATGQHVFIECVLISMAIKLRQDDRRACGLEQGFVDRVKGDFPHAVDNALVRALRHRPGALN